MDSFFSQEELFWLDDILPGRKAGRVRRLSAARHVHIPASKNEYPDETGRVITLEFLLSPPTERS